MCGIVGLVGNGASNKTEIEDRILRKAIESLKKLEYRGYDSSGIATLIDNEFVIFKEKGKIVNLENSIINFDYNPSAVIAHTRWATHGKPSKENAHPHASHGICVVHNGIIENHQEIKSRLIKNGVKFLSETDTEVVPHLIEYHYSKTRSILKAIIESTHEMEGAYALAILCKNEPNKIFFAKKGSPLILGIGNGMNYISSDFYAISNYTNKLIFIEDGDFGYIAPDEYEIFDQNSEKVKRKIKTMDTTKNEVTKEGYSHFMLKEIHEQPRTIEDTIQAYVSLTKNQIILPNFPFDLDKISKITIIACGTSYYAGLCAKYLIEDIAKIEVEVDIASEYRYKNPVHRKDNLMIFISQSGETADTIAALKYAKENKQKILSIVNVAHSSMAQLSDAVIRTVAGPEIGVASTKAYIGQISVLYLFALKIAECNKILTDENKRKFLNDLAEIENKMNEVLTADNHAKIKKISRNLTKAKQILYIGRGISQVTSFESALKLRELSYINSFGIAAGELKHGTIAVIDKKVPVVVIAPHNKLFEKTLSNAEEVKARNGKIIFISDKEGVKKSKNLTKAVVEIPTCNSLIAESLIPIIVTQLIAYYTALHQGNDVDQPRNLAKSVTVE